MGAWHRTGGTVATRVLRVRSGRQAEGVCVLDRERIRSLLQAVRSGEKTFEQAIEALACLPFVDTPHARVDTHRALRTGLPEVVYGPGKTAEQIVEILGVLREVQQTALVTRVEPQQAEAVAARLADVAYDATSRLLWWGREPSESDGKGCIAVVCAGTADLPVAREAVGVAQYFGNRVEFVKDVGVAGLHRLLAEVGTLREARVIIAVAGMEGALASVVGGVVDKPVIAVPTSVGYGASFGGLSALLTMLNSCASNVTVVNIDNGYGAAHVATLINRL